jgi:hypothetical protein
MPAYIPLPGFVAHGLGRRMRRRRSTAPILINWATYENAPANGLVMVDTKAMQMAEQIDMVQTIKWDNPIGAAVFVQSDSGDLVKLPPYSNGVSPILIGEGDAVTMQIDPSIPTPPPAWNTLVTFMSVPAELAINTTPASGVQFQTGAVGSDINAVWSPSLNGFTATAVFDNIALSTTAATLVNLPQNAAGLGIHGGGAILGMSLFFTPASFAAAAVGEIDIRLANVAANANSYPIKIAFPVSASGQVLPYQVSGISLPWTYLNGGTFPQITGILPVTLAPGTVTVSGSIALLLNP